MSRSTARGTQVIWPLDYMDRCLLALQTMLRIRIDCDKLLVAVMPRSRTELDCGRALLPIFTLTASLGLQIFRTQHLFTDIMSCHMFAHCCNESRARWRTSQLMSFTVLHIISNALILTPILSSNSINSLIYTRNIGGPMMLPCTTPETRSALSDKMLSIFVWCVYGQWKSFSTKIKQIHECHNGTALT